MMLDIIYPQNTHYAMSDQQQIVTTDECWFSVENDITNCHIHYHVLSIINWSIEYLSTN